MSKRNFFSVAVVFFAVFFMVSTAKADGPGSPAFSNSTVGDSERPVEMIGEPEKRTSYQTPSAYTLAQWEKDLNRLIDDINEMFPRFNELIENQELLVSKPDGEPYLNVSAQLNKLAEMVEDAVTEAGTNTIAMEKLKELQKEVDVRLERLENYTFGPQRDQFVLALTGEGKGIFDVDLNNGETVEVRYAVGSTRSITPGYEDHPVVAVMALPPNATNEKNTYAYAYGIALRGENTVIMTWDSIPHSYKGAEWKATTVHNLGPEAWGWISCRERSCTPASANEHYEERYDK